MSITVPTIDEMQDVLKGVLNGPLPEILVTPDSDAGVRIRMLAEALLGLFVEEAAIERDLIPSDQTETAALELHAEARLGPGARKGPSVAKGTEALKVYGSAGSTVYAGDTLAHSSGARYQVTVGGTVGAAPNEWVLVDVESITKGTDANLAIGDTLTFEDPRPGITSVADVVAAIDGAEDAESDGALLARLLDAYRNPPAGGRASDYRQWAQAVESVLSAYVYCPSSSALEGRRGMGVADVAILKSGTGASRIPSSTVQQAVLDHIEERRPCTTKDIAVLLPDADEQDVHIIVTPKTGYGFDWAKTSSAVVSSWNPSTLELEWSEEVDAGCVADCRILVAGQLNEVESVPSAYVTKMKYDFATAPEAFDSIFPGGPLTEPLQEAIRDYFDSLGPAKGAAADPEQDWDDTLRVSKLIDVVMDVPGMADASVSTPAANVVPTDHAPSGTVDLIVYGEIVVRPA